MLDCLPRTHIKAHFAGYGEQSVSAQARNGKKIDSTLFVQQFAHVNATANARRRITLFGGCWGLTIRSVGIGSELFANRPLAVSDLALIELVQLYRLPQGKQMLITVVADERLSDGLLTAMATGITMTCQQLRIALTGEDRLEDLHSSDSSDI